MQTMQAMREMGLPIQTFEESMADAREPKAGKGSER